jgi:uncharacterized OsmC-like protein
MIDLNKSRLVVACATYDINDTCINIQDYFFNSQLFYLLEDDLQGATPFELLLAALNSGLSLYMMKTAQARNLPIKNIVVSSNYRKNINPQNPEVELYVDIIGDASSSEVAALFDATENFTLYKMIQKAMPVYLRETVLSEVDISE